MGKKSSKMLLVGLCYMISPSYSADLNVEKNNQKGQTAYPGVGWKPQVEAPKKDLKVETREYPGVGWKPKEDNMTVPKEYPGVGWKPKASEKSNK